MLRKKTIEVLTYKYVLCLDASLASTGLVLLQIIDGKVTVVLTETLRTTTDEPDYNRQTDVLLQLAAVCNRYQLTGTNTVVALEDYGSSKIRGKLYQRVELTGMIKLFLTSMRGIGFYMILPRNLKLFMGHGSLKKPDMRRATLESFGFNAPNEHICDAYCLGRYLIAYLLGQRLNLKYLPPVAYLSTRLQPSANNLKRTVKPPLTPIPQRPTLPLRIAKLRS